LWNDIFQPVSYLGTLTIRIGFYENEKTYEICGSNPIRTLGGTVGGISVTHEKSLAHHWIE
jgi:hypothetical protein